MIIYKRKIHKKCKPFLRKQSRRTQQQNEVAAKLELTKTNSKFLNDLRETLKEKKKHFLALQE